MAFKIEQTGTSAACVEGYLEPTVTEVQGTVVDPITNATVNRVPTYTQIDRPGEFTEGCAKPSNTWIDPKEGEQTLILMPINWQLVNDEVINGGSYNLADLSADAEATAITVKYKSVTPADGSVANSEEVVEWVELEGLEAKELGVNVYSVKSLTDFEVKIEPDSTLLSTYSPLVDVDGKWSDAGVLDSIKFTSNKNHRINIHWSDDCVETFYFVASL